MNYLTHFTRPLRRRFFSSGFLTRNLPPPASPAALRILVVGIYLTDHPSQASRLIKDFAISRQHQVDQIWAALGQQPPSDPSLSAVTALHSTTLIPKFPLINQLLENRDLHSYDYVLFSDDDMALCPRFIDHYIGWIHHLGFSISQPARTRYSHRDHKFCLQMRGIKARETRFVEIGPIFTFDRKAMRSLFPFNEKSPMGWGNDFVWPVVAEHQQLHMGIVDATPVDHSYRAQSRTYKSNHAFDSMKDYLNSEKNLAPELAKVNLKIYR